LKKGEFKVVFKKARNSHIENQSLSMRLLTKPDQSLYLEADMEASTVETIVALVRSLDYEMDKEVRETLEAILGREVQKGTFSKWKQAAVRDGLITLKEWEECLSMKSQLEDLTL
jgi:hypothetical protein